MANMDAANIARLRKDLGLSQIDFGRLFDAHFMTVSKWERGIATPTPYQAALMDQFRQAADAQKEQVQQQVKSLLVGAGVIAAIFWLLQTAKK